MRGKRIFISYRHADGAGEARSIFSELREHFGADRVFQDIRSLPKGDDFKAALAAALDQAAVVVAVIGPSWLTLTDGEGTRRLDREDDLVRQELAAALDRGIPIIPVLVNGAHMPRAADLPENIQRLSAHLGMHLSHANFTSDIGALLQALEPRVGSPRVALSAGRMFNQLKERFRGIPRWAQMLAVAAGVIGVILLADPALIAQANVATRIMSTPSDRIPLSATVQEDIRTLLPRPTSTSCREFEEVTDRVLWGPAQSYVTCGAPAGAFASFAETADRFLTRSCMCWRAPMGFAHYTDFWVMEAYSANAAPLRSDVLDRILSSQTPDGWFPIYLHQRTTGADAPLYLTALMTIALRKQEPLVTDQELRARIHAAIAKAEEWLLAAEPAATGEWSDYPSNSRQVASHMFGAMVLTALSQETASDRYRHLARNWVRDLEFSPASLYLGSDALIPTTDGDGFVFSDNYRHVPFSWEICGMASSWSSMTFSQKVSALLKFERSVHKEAARTDPFGRPWVRSEAAYCLTQLQQIAA